MNEGARRYWGAAENIVDTMRGGPSASGETWQPGKFCFTPVWEASDCLLVGGHQDAPLPPSDDLLHLHSKLRRHYERLEVAEKRLAGGLWRHQPRTGAIRQIELERQRLGRELHTNVGQLLAAIRLHLELLVTQLPAPPPAVLQGLDRIAKLSADALDQVRTIARRLHPPEWQRLRIEDAIRQVWQVSGIPERFTSRLNIQELPEQPSVNVKVVLYRALQELLSNVIRHSRASQVDAVLAREGGNAVLRVEDDGSGFDVQELVYGPVDLARGIGLRSIREQTVSLGGGFRIESSPGGTLVEVSLPLGVHGTGRM
jgi:signal transduction histidine kinase